MLFASKPGSPAVSGMDGTSKCTDQFLKFFPTVPKDSIIFPYVFNDWPYSDGEETGEWKLKLSLCTPKDSNTATHVADTPQ